MTAKRRLDRGHHPAARHPLAHLEVGEGLRLALEPVGELVGAPHRLAEQDPGDRERLLDEARDVGERLLGRLRDPPSLLADAARQEHEERDQREGEQRQLPAEQDHPDHRREHRRDARDDRGGRVRDDALDAADVVGDARLHLARARAGEEREREPLQVAEDRGAQVVHHALADLVREQRLPDAEHAVDDRDHDHPGGEHRDLLGVLVVDRLQQVAEQERRDDAERRRDEDQPEHDGEPAPVRPEEAARSASGSPGERPGRPAARAFPGSRDASLRTRPHGRERRYARAVQRVCVFCGASSGRLPAYAEAARAFGAAAAARGIGVVYGGGRVGLDGRGRGRGAGGGRRGDRRDPAGARRPGARARRACRSSTSSARCTSGRR